MLKSEKGGREKDRQTDRDRDTFNMEETFNMELGKKNYLSVLQVSASDPLITGCPVYCSLGFLDSDFALVP